MRLVWYIKRLQNMELAEFLHRLVELPRKITSRFRDQGWHRFPSRPLSPIFADLRRSTQSATTEQRHAISSAAGETLAGRFTALGKTWPERRPGALFPADLWRLDPVTGGWWPGADTYSFRIDFRHNTELGDIKYVWEINRLQFLPPLAACFVLTADDQCLVAIEAAIDSWYTANPPFSGVGWISGIEVALRAISLILTYEMVGDKLSSGTVEQISSILSASSYWLPRFPSRFSSANNHFIAELAGEYLTGLSLGSPSLQARDALLHQIEMQIFEDGTGAEQTPTYAAFSAELALICAAAARQSEVPFPRSFDARLAALADFLGWLGADSVGYGDDDEGRVLTLGHESDYKLSVGAAVHGFLGEPGVTAEIGDFRAIIFGRPAGSLPPKQGLRTFQDGGLSIWHGELAGRRVDLTFDHGPLGYLAIAAHGHADALALTVAIDGAPVLTDPGTWQYGAGGVWRNWFRSTPAHNTLNIENQSQSVIAGAFNWSHKAVAKLVESESEPNWRLSAEHDGYRGRFGVVHRRQIGRQGSEITLTDSLIGGPRRANMVFQVATLLTTELHGDTVTIARSGVVLMRIQFQTSDIIIARGGEMPGQGGWVSPSFGIREPADRIVWSGMVDDGGVHTRLIVQPAE